MSYSVLSPLDSLLLLGALYLSVFEQPASRVFFSLLPGCVARYKPGKGSVVMEEESLQKTNAENAKNDHDEPTGEEPSVDRPSEGRKDAQKGSGWTVWALVILIGFLLVSSLANLVVSQRAYQSSREQVKAIEQLTQSIKDVQRSIMNLSKMIEQSPQEEEEPEEDSGGVPRGDGSI